MSDERIADSLTQCPECSELVAVPLGVTPEPTDYDPHALAIEVDHGPFYRHLLGHYAQRLEELGQGWEQRNREALDSCALALTTSARDQAQSRDTAWLYALLVGWECEDNHDHDGVCGGSDALYEVARHHGWDQSDVERIRRLRTHLAGSRD